MHWGAPLGTTKVPFPCQVCSHWRDRQYQGLFYISLQINWDRDKILFSALSSNFTADFLQLGQPPELQQHLDRHLLSAECVLSGQGLKCRCWEQ